MNIFVAATNTTSVKTQVTKPKIQITSNQSLSTVKMETDESLKRKREEEDYDMS